jgi:serine phosphatase RsbU (regulator of sigma subunit)
LAFLHILKGTKLGQKVPLNGKSKIILGRNEDSDVVIKDPAVSPVHARILVIHNQFHLIDGDVDSPSRNHTYVNNRLLDKDPVPLKDNDRIEICDFMCTFHEGGHLNEGDAESEEGYDETSSGPEVFVKTTHSSDEVANSLDEAAKIDWFWEFLVDGDTILPEDSGGPTQAMDPAQNRSNSREVRRTIAPAVGDWSVESECDRLAEMVQDNHVHAEYAPSLYKLMCREFQKSYSEGNKKLARDFYRVVFLDIQKGLNVDGKFDLKSFLDYAARELVHVFDLKLVKDVVAEDITQILKDEPRSLFCFLNVHHVPERMLTRLRGFTQELHQALMLSEVQSEATIGLPLLLPLLFPRILEGLFQIFKQAERGFIFIREERPDGKLIPKVIKTRSAHDETNAPFSKTIVNRCIQSNQALLSEDATTDKKLDPRASIADCRIRSVMCAPLTARDNTRAFGVIQLDSQDRTKRFTSDDLKLLVAVASQAAITLEYARLHEVLLVRDRLRRDMELARAVQLSFLPRRLPEVAGYSFFAHYEPAAEVGGDYYDFIPVPKRGWAVMIGDVAGKGVLAALLMAKISSDARFCMLTEERPESAIVELNSLLHQAGLSDRFVTLAAGMLDPNSHEVTFVNAGHPSPLIYRKATGKLEEVVPRDLTGLPLGVVEGYSYDPCPVTLSPGDSVLIFTDGVTDAKNKQGADFQLQGVYNALKEGPYTAQAMGERLVKAVKQHSLGCKQHDDIAVVGFGRT